VHLILVLMHHFAYLVFKAMMPTDAGDPMSSFIQIPGFVHTAGRIAVKLAPHTRHYIRNPSGWVLNREDWTCAVYFGSVGVHGKIMGDPTDMTESLDILVEYIDGPTSGEDDGTIFRRTLHNLTEDEKDDLLEEDLHKDLPPRAGKYSEPTFKLKYQFGNYAKKTE
jgi:hypothetical protein